MRRPYPSASHHKILATGTMPQMLRLWDVQQGVQIKKWRLPKHRFWKPTASIVYAIAFGKDSQTLITEDSSGHENLWEIGL